MLFLLSLSEVDLLLCCGSSTWYKIQLCLSFKSWSDGQTFTPELFCRAGFMILSIMASQPGPVFSAILSGPVTHQYLITRAQMYCSIMFIEYKKNTSLRNVEAGRGRNQESVKIGKGVETKMQCTMGTLERRQTRQRDEQRQEVWRTTQQEKAFKKNIILSRIHTHYSAGAFLGMEFIACSLFFYKAYILFLILLYLSGPPLTFPDYTLFLKASLASKWSSDQY